MNVGNLISTPTIELASGMFNEKFDDGGLPCALVATLVLLVFTVLSGDEALDLTYGDAPSVV